MSVTHIQQSIYELTTFLSEHPDVTVIPIKRPSQLWKKDCAVGQKGQAVRH
jgi:hypothetical protein